MNDDALKKLWQDQKFEARVAIALPDTSNEQLCGGSVRVRPLGNGHVRG